MNLERTLASKDRMYEEKDASTLPVGHDPIGHLPGKTALSGSKLRPSSESSCKSYGKCKRARRQWADSEEVWEDAALNKSQQPLISRRQFFPPTGWKAKSCFEAQGWFLLAIGGWKVCLVDLYPVKIIQDMHMPHICMARHLQTTYQHAMSFEQL